MNITRSAMRGSLRRGPVSHQARWGEPLRRGGQEQERRRASDVGASEDERGAAARVDRAAVDGGEEAHPPVADAEDEAAPGTQARAGLACPARQARADVHPM